MITFDKISFGYDKQLLFKDFSWTIATDNGKDLVHFLLSPSGSGKTTLFKLLLSLLNPASGVININDNARIAYVPQEPILFEHLSIYDNATFFKRIKDRKKEFDHALFTEFAKALAIDNDLLKSNKKISELSGGQKRKISLLKALSLNPNILLLDEPTTGLDAKVKIEVLTLIKKIAIEYNILVLYITHHFEEAEMIGDKIHYLIKSNNNIIQSTSIQTIEEFKKYPPSLDAVYLVDFPKNRLERGDLNNNTFTQSDIGNYIRRNYKDNFKIYKYKE